MSNYNSAAYNANDEILIMTVIATSGQRISAEYRAEYIAVLDIVRTLTTLVGKLNTGVDLVVESVRGDVLATSAAAADAVQHNVHSIQIQFYSANDDVTLRRTLPFKSHLMVEELVTFTIRWMAAAGYETPFVYKVGNSIIRHLPRKQYVREEAGE
jgi:hypothetical protein